MRHDDVVAGVDGAVEVEIARHGGHLVRDEDALRAVGEAGPEGELADVVEGAGPAVAVAGVADEAQVADRAEVAGRHFQFVALANDELQVAAAIGRPNTEVVRGIHARAGEALHNRDLAGVVQHDRQSQSQGCRNTVPAGVPGAWSPSRSTNVKLPAESDK